MRVRRNKRQIEAQYQRAVIQWCKYLEAHIPELRWLHAIPNGGKRDARTAALLKAEGVKAGVLDLFWPWPRSNPSGPRWHGLYIEMKAPEGALSEEQKNFARFVMEQGYCVRIAFDPHEAMLVIKAYAAGALEASSLF